MISLYDGQLTDILPPNFKNDHKVIALSHAIQKLTQHLLDQIRKTAIYATIDEQPDEVIDLMAAELRTNHYYDQRLDIQTKRELVKNALSWHTYAGTPAAIEEMLSTVFGEGTIEEWFEYGGEPYNFKVHINGILRPGMFDDFEQLIKKVKNTRSRVEDVEAKRKAELDAHLAGTLFSVYKPAMIDCRMNRAQENTATPYVKMAGFKIYKPSIIDSRKGENNDATNI